MIAIIPARGGSKGLPGKNIRILCGKPLIAYTIEAAKEAKCISKVIVSTDSEEIAETARAYGAETPFIRPESLSDDTASAVDVYLHAVDFLQKAEQTSIKTFMVLLPTAPFRTAQDIDRAYECFVKENAMTLISVREAETPASWYLVETPEARLKNAGFSSGSVMQNRQANTGYYIPNGAIYILDVALLREKRTYYCDHTIAFHMSREKSVDIDDLMDFEFAEFIMSRQKMH